MSITHTFKEICKAKKGDLAKIKKFMLKRKKLYPRFNKYYKENKNQC